MKFLIVLLAAALIISGHPWFGAALFFLYVGMKSTLWFFEAYWLHGDMRLAGFLGWLKYMVRQ